MLDIAKHYKKFFLFSGILVSLSILSLIFFRLVPGIDFAGGSLFELKFEQLPQNKTVVDKLAEVGFENTTVQPTGETSLILKTRAVNSQDERDVLFETLRQNFGKFEEVQSDTIGPVIGQELARKARWQVALVVLGILLYVAYAFRNLGEKKTTKTISSWRLSWAAIVALVHDIVILLGVFSVLGRFLSIEVDTMFITAVLTTLGFSVNDTIVVFDRLREHMAKDRGLSFPEVVNKSVSETLTRSLNTSFTILFVLFALLFFGGDTTFYFVLAMIIGISIGTYSSIFIASPLLIAWSREE